MSSQKNQVSVIIEKLFRTEYGKMVSYLTNKFGFNFLENAEDIVQETLSVAFQKWTYSGIPENPEAWIFVVARNKALNLVKKESRITHMNITKLVEEYSENHTQLHLAQEIEDGMLRIMVVCCNMDLPVHSKIVFILSCLCGFSRKELSQALLVKEETVKKRLFRAKSSIRLQELNIASPKEELLSLHANVICNVLYILYNAGYNSSGNKSLIRREVCFEAMRLTKLILNQDPGNPRAHALFALMCFHSARFDSRIDKEGAIVLFKDQDRNLWSKELINAGMYHLSKASNGARLSAYHMEAAIAAEHCTSSNFESTNWDLILSQYQQLYRLKPTPIILLNLAIVQSMLGKTSHAITELVNLTKNKQLNSNYLLHATLGELYGKSGQHKRAIEALEKALALTNSKQEKALLQKKRENLLRSVQKEI
ncbi:RNA polymerase sigma factor [Spongiimicrobium sp. 3-5]|uniref:RNA polymerase sigma factor n=1 Tax=Spongiimicrobium sp. 3-5 TaxID=3332596 RepID=UPI00398175DB